METALALSGISGIEDLLRSLVGAPQELDDAFNVSCLAQIEEEAHIALPLRGNTCFRLPF